MLKIYSYRKFLGYIIILHTFNMKSKYCFVSLPICAHTDLHLQEFLGSTVHTLVIIDM